MNINELRELCPVEEFADEESLFEKLNSVKAKFDISTDEASQAHGESDYRLIVKLENNLIPILGEPGSKGNRWFHLLDFYGDGVRFIEAEWTTLTMPVIKLLRELLSGEHERFCVVWNVYEDFHGSQNGARGSAAVFADRIFVTNSVLCSEK